MLEIINNEYPDEVIVAIDEVGRGCFLDQYMHVPLL